MTTAAPTSPKPPRRWFRQFRLATVFFVMLAASLPLTWMAAKARRARARTAAEARIIQMGGTILHERYGAPNFGLILSHINLDHTSVGDDDLALLLAPFDDLPSVHLNLTNTEVSNAGLEKLKAMQNLRYLSFDGSHVTAAGFQKLKQSIPALETDKSL